MDGRRELYGAHHSNFGGRVEVITQALYEMGNIECNLDENIEHFERCDAERHQTAVAVMHEQVGANLGCREVVHTASPVSHVAQNDDFGESKLLQNVADHTRVHQQTLRKLRRSKEQ
jgi:hypothetical protein